MAFEVASALGAPLDVFVVRKLGLPIQPELAMGAIASGGVLVLNERVVAEARVSRETFDEVAAREAEELARRERLYRGDRPPLQLAGKTVLLVDDGLATGSTMRAAVAAVRKQGAARVVVAVPVAPLQACEELRGEADDVVCVRTPEDFIALSAWYQHFPQTEDEEIRRLLDRARGQDDETAVVVPADGVELEGTLAIPDGVTGVVLFAHGSGSSRHSPRNRYVADVLNGAGLATVLIDLLSAEEEAVDAATAELRFDIGLLARRLGAASDWLAANPTTSSLPLGYFGASTGAAAALVAAAERPDRVGAIVSRGGRPDLAGDALARVRAPTLLIAGGADEQVVALNREAFQKLDVEKELAIVPGATHLFEEPGALEQVAELARQWFSRHLRGSSA